MMSVIPSLFIPFRHIKSFLFAQGWLRGDQLNCSKLAVAEWFNCWTRKYVCVCVCVHVNRTSTRTITLRTVWVWKWVLLWSALPRLRRLRRRVAECALSSDVTSFSLSSWSLRNFATCTAMNTCRFFWCRKFSDSYAFFVVDVLLAVDCACYSPNTDSRTDCMLCRYTCDVKYSPSMQNDDSCASCAWLKIYGRWEWLTG